MSAVAADQRRPSRATRADHVGMGLHAVTVVGVRRLTPHLVRITLGAPTLQGFRDDGPDQRFKLMLPRAGQRRPALPDVDEGVTQQLSLELLGDLADCDVILYLTNAQGVPDPSTRAVTEQPLFRTLPAARNGLAVPLAHYYATHYGQGQAVLDQVKGVLQRL